MNIIKIINYERIINDFLNKYENVVTSIQEKITIVVYAVINVISTISNIAADIALGIYTVGRYMTFPIHFIWIWGWLRIIRKKDDTLPIFNVGAHYIYGLPAAGKSTMVYHAMMDWAYRTGKSSYTTEQMEMPRKDLNGTEYYHHQVFEPSDFFEEGEQKYSFDPDFNIVVYEEMLTKYNQRNNKQRAYNDEVIPMIGSMGTQRHQGIDLFYFISQQPKADVQIMNMLAGYHIPKIRKVFDYKKWLETGKFSFRIKGWWIKSSTIIPTGADGYKISKPKRWFYENTHSDIFEYFNRLNMKAKFDKLPRAERRGMTA